MTPTLTSAGQAESSAVERERAERTVRGPSHVAEQAGTVIETSSQVFPGNGRTYEERRDRRRLVGFSVCIPLWVLSVVPLARESLDGRESVDALLVYLAVGALSLGAAAVTRGVYVMLAKRRLWLSPWVFLIAAVMAITGYAVQSAGEEVPVVSTATLESRAE
jgi:hypothetical protein